MAQPTVLDFYKYSVLATAAYVRMGSKPLDGATFAAQAASSPAQERLPIALGTALFNPPDNTTPRWNILRYYGVDNTADAIAAADKSGLGATLFARGSGATTEKVLAIRGTEPTADGTVDLISADLGQIGILGLALTQVVAAVNLIQRMLATPGTNVDQIQIKTSIIPPLSTESGVGPGQRIELM